MSFASDQVARLETLLAANVGVASVTVDGQTVSYDDLLKQYTFWQNRAAKASNSRPFASHIRLDNAI